MSEKYYSCSGCAKEFEDYVILRTTYENYYGLNIGSHTPLELCVCPHCDSEEIMELDREEEDV